jgi:hypothetical protein
LRPTDEQDQVIRRLARRDGAALADTRALFAAQAAYGIPGDDLFMDAHHPNLRGHILLARSFASQISRILGAPVVRGDPSEAEVRREFDFSDRDLAFVYATRFLWFCGESSHRADPAQPLRSARRYLGLAERGYGRRSPAFRFLLALLEHDPAEVARCLSDESAILQDRENLSLMGGYRDWDVEILSGPLAAEARKILALAGTLSEQGRGGAGARPVRPAPRPVPPPGGGGAQQKPAAAPEDPRYRQSKAVADRGVGLMLSGDGERGRRELEQALKIYPENMEAALSLCTWYSQQEQWETAWRYCDEAWASRSSGAVRYSAQFLEQCRSARERVRLRLHKPQDPPSGGSKP